MSGGGPVQAFAEKLALALEARAKKHADEARRVRLAVKGSLGRTAAAEDDAKAQVYRELADVVREATP